VRITTVNVLVKHFDELA